jgi:hypothetical protein
VAAKAKVAGAAVKLEPLDDMQHLQQQSQVWQLPHQPLEQSTSTEALPVSGRKRKYVQELCSETYCTNDVCCKHSG